MALLVAAQSTSDEHQEAPPCDLDWLEDLPALLRLWGAGKALTTLSRRLHLLTFAVVTSARGREAAVVEVNGTNIPSDFDRRYLGHMEMAMAGSDRDLRAKLQRSTTDFHKVRHMWQHDMIDKHDKFRMLMRYIQQMIYGGEPYDRCHATSDRA